MKKIIRINKRFFDFASRYYDSGLMRKLLNGILEKMLREVKIKNNSEVLDAGCGTGNLLALLEKNKTLRLEGIDISKKMLDIARKKLKRAELKLISAENITYKNKFKYIFSTEAFHHYYNQEKAMKNFYSALKNKGKLVIVDLDFGRILNFIFHLIEPGNSRMNSAKDFYEIFKKYKFRNIKQKRIKLFVISTIGEKLRKENL